MKACEFFPIIIEKLFYNRNASFKDTGKKGWVIVVSGNFLSWLVGFIIIEVYIL